MHLFQAHIHLSSLQEAERLHSQEAKVGVQQKFPQGCFLDYLE